MRLRFGIELTLAAMKTGAKRQRAKHAAETGMSNVASVVDVESLLPEVQIRQEVFEVLLTVPKELPIPVQELLIATTEQGLPGDVASGLVNLWAMGKVEYVPVNIWDGTPGGWQLTVPN